MSDISNLMGRLNTKVTYRQFNDPVTPGQTQSPRLAAPLEQSEPVVPQTEPQGLLASLPPAAEPEHELFVIEPRADGRIIEAPRPAIIPPPIAKPIAPRMIEPPLGPPPSRPAAAPRPVANPGGSLLRRYGPAPTEPPRTLPEVFAWLQSKRR